MVLTPAKQASQEAFWEAPNSLVVPDACKLGSCIAEGPILGPSISWMGTLGVQILDGLWIA